MMKDPAESNPTEKERLRNMLGEKEVAPVERAEEVNRWLRKKADTQAKLQRASELLQQKEQEFEVER